MESKLLRRLLTWLSFILMFIQNTNEAFASHAQSADLTYRCLGGNQYELSLSFYRDCAGVAAPGTVQIDIASASCGQNYNITLNQIAGTGIDVSPICTAFNTECSGGTYPGVQEYIYRGVTTLPASCTDWVFSFTLCCRNATIGTIVNPSAESIYVEAHLDNLNFPCNSSPTFSNPPIPFVCTSQPYCFNNGSSDPDGDSLYFTLIAPQTSATTTVTYNAPYSAAQPLASSPAVTFNNLTGDMCMSPTLIQVTVFAVLVQEYRNEILVGSVMRDIQMRTIACTNNNPYVQGINNTGVYSTAGCAGVPINFTIDTYDADAGQNVSIVWNSGIAGASFISSGGARPTATFSWTPTAADISTASHCFTVTVQDDNCPYNGSQTFAFCITVSGIVLNTTSTPANCGASNGTADVSVITGTGPYTYAWSSGGSTSSENGLNAGTYTVTVTGSGGCNSSATTTVGTGAAPGNVNMNGTNVSCYGGNDGSAIANASGGAAPYTYAWSNGASTATVFGLTAGTYYVTVTTANGCVKTDSIVITQPATALTFAISHLDITCFGLNNGSSIVSPSGGTGPYSYFWNTTPAQTTSTVSNLTPGVHTVVVTDDNGCTLSTSVNITEPDAINANAMVINQVTCNGMSNGFATVGASGGTGFYNYMWNTAPASFTQTISGLSPGTYTATVSDANNCTATSSITITQPPVLTLASAGFPVTCNGMNNGQGVVIPSGGTPTYSYQWLPSGGSMASTGATLAPGTYTVTATDANGCTVNTSITITQPAPLITIASGGTTICAGTPTTVSAVATGGTAGYVFNWTGVGTGATQSVSPTSNTTYTVVATDAQGCVGTTAMVTVNTTTLTLANLTVSGGSSMCAGNVAMVYSSVNGSTGPVNVTWSNGLGSGNGPFTVSPSTSTTYTVTVTDNCGNVVTASVPVTVHPLPVISLSPQSVEECEKATLTYVDNSPTNAGCTYLWSFGDGGMSTQVSPDHSYSTSGTYVINVTVTSPYGCVSSASTTSTVIVNPGTTAAFSAEGMDGTMMNPLWQFYDQSTNALTRVWSFGDGAGSTLTDPQHMYASKGVYVVSLVTTTDKGCKDSAWKEIEVKPVFTLYIPNAFTPDGNGNNDNFAAKGVEISEFNMMIFDRWGELIFESNDINKGWDGRANNGDKIAEQGVYVYKIVVRDFAQKHHDYTGHVTLLASNE